jgi:hypothetical protein
MSKRIDWSWRSWGVRVDHPRGFYVVHTPLGNVGLDCFHRVTTPGISRGRCQEYDLRIPLGEHWQVHLSTKGKDYLALVNGPKYLRNTGWIIDEFDASFNDLACASLRYHLDYSVCDNEDRRERYEDLIRRLSESEPETTKEEHAAIETWHPLSAWDDEYKTHVLTECPPEASAAFDTWNQRIAEHHARIDQARHDFIDTMRELWS